MALVLRDRVKETSTTAGTGTYTLAGAVTGFETFNSVGNGNTTYYGCSDGVDFEVGIGTYTASGTTLARTTILQSSNSDSAVNWGTGTRTIFCTLPAEKMSFLDASGNVVAANGSALTALNASNLGSGTVANARLDAQLQDVAGLAVTNGGFIVGNGSNFVLETEGTARTSLGLGTSAVLDTGISNTNVPKFTSGVADDDFLRIAGTAVEGRSASEVLSDIGAITASSSATLTNKSIAASQLTGALPAISGASLTNLPGGADLYAANESSPSGQPSATGANAVAIGETTKATGADSFAVNVDNTDKGATGVNSFAMGKDAYAQGDYSFAFGRSARTGNSADYGVAIGRDAYATGANNVSIGYDATTLNGSQLTAIGYEALCVGGSNSVSIGKAYAAGVGALALNNLDNSGNYGALSNYAVAIGYQAKATANFSMALGGQSNIASASHAIAMGDTSTASHANAVSIGDSVQSTAANQINLGGTADTVRISETYALPKVDGSANQVLTTNGSGVVSFADAGGGADLYAANESSPNAQPSALGANAIAIGNTTKAGTQASHANAIAIGGSNNTSQPIQATNQFAVAIGTAYYGAVTASSDGSMAIGTGATVASASGSLALGKSSTAAGNSAVSLSVSYASGANSLAAAIANNTSSYGATATGAIAIGNECKATGNYSISIGRSNNVSGPNGASALGQSCTVSGEAAFAAGNINIASGAYSQAIGNGANTANIHGKFAKANGYFNNYADAQYGQFVLRGNTTDATAKVLTTNNNAAAATNQIILPNTSAYAFHGTIVGREDASDGTDCCAFKVEGLIRREANAGTTVLVNSATTVIDNTPNWSMALSADTTNGGLSITMTGAASTNIRFVATIHTSEVTYA